ncbi:MAG: nucleoside triphosphate hydrolase [marine bacterium B5-7]|nr:MAG: nucleoside triphosphate hydrolase [marine bacterium B5-7]
MRASRIPELKAQSAPTSFHLTPEDNYRLAQLCGEVGVHLKLVEERFGVRISHRGNLFYIDGRSKDVGFAERVIKDLYDETGNTSNLSKEDVHLAMTRTRETAISAPVEDPVEDPIEDASRVLKVGKTSIRAMNPNQRQYIRNIETHDVSFGVGPAGTGKTYLAVASAVLALSNGEVDRIILVRPAVEAGERLGFLPGDIGQKVDPYVRPLYDALYEMLGFERVGKLVDRGIIELAPLAYMRGRTLNDAFIILDEAQNTTREQMKMFLTRIGFGSRAVITGDPSQVDLPSRSSSGLVHALKILDGLEGISVLNFRSRDVVRHRLVQCIVDAYEAEQAWVEQEGS